MALVWVGKSPLAELTTAVASLWICVIWDFSPLIPLPLKLLSPLTEFSRLARSVQYAGLLLPQPASATTAMAAAQASRTQARPALALMPPGLPATHRTSITPKG